MAKQDFYVKLGNVAISKSAVPAKYQTKIIRGYVSESMKKVIEKQKGYTLIKPKKENLLKQLDANPTLKSIKDKKIRGSAGVLCEVQIIATSSGLLAVESQGVIVKREVGVTLGSNYDKDVEFCIKSASDTIWTHKTEGLFHILKMKGFGPQG